MKRILASRPEELYSRASPRSKVRAYVVFVPCDIAIGEITCATFIGRGYKHSEHKPEWRGEMCSFSGMSHSFSLLFLTAHANSSMVRSSVRRVKYSSHRVFPAGIFRKLILLPQ